MYIYVHIMCIYVITLLFVFFFNLKCIAFPSFSFFIVITIIVFFFGSIRTELQWIFFQTAIPLWLKSQVRFARHFCLNLFIITASSLYDSILSIYYKKLASWNPKLKRDKFFIKFSNYWICTDILNATLMP